MRPGHPTSPECLQVEECLVIDNKENLISWYADHPSEYGKLWDPTANDGQRVELHVPRMIGLPLQAASLYHQIKGAVMPHELLDTVEQHLASPTTSLDNGDNWGLVQKWLLVAAQKDGGSGDPAKSKSLIAFCTDALLSNNDLIHRWMTENLNAMLGMHPDKTRVGIQGNMAVVQNMSGIITTEVGCGLGVAMQNASKAGPTQADGTKAGKDVKPYTQDQGATLLGFHGAMNARYLMKMWRLFKVAKTPNYNHLHWAIKGEMIRWADRQ
jgi:hypothetical protein